jgi:FkbM family methyltransferase
MKIRSDKHFFLRLLNKVQMLQYCNLYPEVDLGTQTIKLPIVGGIGYENLTPGERWFDDVLKLVFELKDGAFIDVGVNLCQTLLKFLEFSSGRTYYGFEPNPLCVSYAETLRAKNNLKQVHIIPIGLSNHNSVEELFLGSDYDSSASIVEGFRPAEFYSKSSHIPIFKGDEICERLHIDSLCALKIDVEGAELEVLEGLQNTVASLNPFIICELLPVYEESSERGRFRRERLDKVLEYLRVMNYDICRVSDEGAVWLETVDTHSNLELCNYLFTPKSHSPVVRDRLRAA